MANVFSCIADAIALPLYGEGSGQVHYFSCNGAETGLLSCKQQRICSSSEHAGVMCYNGKCSFFLTLSVSLTTCSGVQ